MYRVLCRFTNDDSPGDPTTAFHIQQQTSLAISIGQTGDIVKAWWNDSGPGSSAQKVNHSDALALDAVTLRRIYPIEPVEQLYTTGLPIMGTVTTLGNQPQDAILVSLRTPFIGRSYRGRNYLPPPADTKLAGPGQLTSGVAQDIATQFNDMIISEFAALDHPVVVWSPLLSVPSEVTTLKVDRFIRTQRRRQDNTPLYETA